MVAQRSSGKNNQSLDNKDATKQHQQTAATDLTSELLKDAAKNKNKNGISIFKDVSAGKNKTVSSNASVGSQSVKSRMKQSLAQRRTALQSRNVNIPMEDGNEGGVKGLKQKALGSTMVQSKATLVEADPAVRSPVQVKQQSEDINQESAHVVEEDVSLGGLVSLDLDISVSSEVLDSMERSYRTVESPMNKSAPEEELSQENAEQRISGGTILETLQEETDEQSCDDDDEDDEEWYQHNPDIERDNDELISITQSCESVSSSSSSNFVNDLKSEEQHSPSSNAISESCALTPAASIQTFSIGSANSQKSHIESQDSGTTQAGSIQTYSIGGRFNNITSDPFKMSIFSPLLQVSDEEYSAMESESGTDPSCSGQTAVPDVSFSSHMFPSPTHHMMYASPSAKVNLSMGIISPSGSVDSTLGELSRQLQDIRSEKKNSSRKMIANTCSTKHLLKMYDDIHKEVENKEESMAAFMGHLSQISSPVSKAIATGDASGLSRSAAASLIERNKTLVKEVRFADQTCVELSERNLSMIREIHKMEIDVDELKGKNDSLHEGIVRASQDITRAVESKKEIDLRLAEERIRFEKELKAGKEMLEQEQERNKVLCEKLDESAKVASGSDQKIASITAAYDTIKSEHTEAKSNVATLRDRLATIESTAELAASSAAQKYREASRDMQRETDSLLDRIDDCEAALQVEREARYKAEEELLDWRDLCEDLEAKQLDESSEQEPVAQSPASPCRSQTSKRTTSSVLLAKTLKFELEKCHEATERIIEAERIIAVTQSKLRETERDLQTSKDEAAELRSHLKSSQRSSKIMASIPNRSDNSSEEPSAGPIARREGTDCDALNKQLLTARSECDEYKQELDSIITQIKGIQTTNGASTETNARPQSAADSGLVDSVRDLAQVCTRVNVAAGDRVGELEIQLKFLAESMNQLHEICAEDPSEVSGNSFCLQMMEEGTTTPVKGNKTPVKVLYLESDGEAVSPVSTDASLVPPRDKTPVKIVRLRTQLFAAEEQLKTVSAEKASLDDALNEAKNQIDLLTSSFQNEITISRESGENNEANAALEKSVSLLRSHITKLEQRIEGLEDDKDCLFDDAAARGDELEDANNTIDSLMQEALEVASLLQKLSDEKQELIEELSSIQSLHQDEIERLKRNTHRLENTHMAANDRVSVLSSELELRMKTITEVEASRDRFQQELQLVSSESEEQVVMIHDLQESAAQARTQQDELKSSFMKCNEELAEAVEATAELEEAKDDLKSIVRAQQTELANRSQRIQSLTDECDEIHSKLCTTEDAYDALHEEVVKMGMQIEILCAVNDEYESDLVTAKEQICGLESEVGEFRTSAETLASDLDISKQDLAKKEEELAEVKLHLESVEDTFESEVHEFKTNAETLASDLGISKKALAKKEEELADVKANLESVEYKIDEFEAKVGEKHEALTREKEAKESELKLLTIHFSEVVSSLQEEQMQRKAFGKEHKAEVAVLKGELDDTNARLEQVRSQL